MTSNDFIDNRRCENVSSNYIAEKLKSQSMEHQDPYKLHWLNKENKVKVSQYCIVSFFISKNYKERLWCDVIPIDVCNIHIWRPWQYDRRALYDGYVNTCTFVKDVIEIKLAPLQLNEFNDRKVEIKLLGLSLGKKPFKDKEKLCLLRPIPKPPWENVGTDFVLGILWIQQQKYSEMIVEDKFLENGSFRPVLRLQCCLEDEQENLDSRTSLFQPGENDIEHYGTFKTWRIF
jgi:hypothetical protein